MCNNVEKFQPVVGASRAGTSGSYGPFLKQSFIRSAVIILQPEDAIIAKYDIKPYNFRQDIFRRFLIIRSEYCELSERTVYVSYVPFKSDRHAKSMEIFARVEKKYNNCVISIIVFGVFWACLSLRIPERSWKVAKALNKMRYSSSWKLARSRTHSSRRVFHGTILSFQLRRSVVESWLLCKLGRGYLLVCEKVAIFQYRNLHYIQSLQR